MTDAEQARREADDMRDKAFAVIQSLLKHTGPDAAVGCTGCVDIVLDALLEARRASLLEAADIAKELASRWSNTDTVGAAIFVNACRMAEERIRARAEEIKA